MVFIRINGVNLNYTELGSGKPFIFLHGIFLDSGAYKKLISTLGNFYRVYAIDLPMHGQSEKPKDYLDISDFSNLLKKFIIKLNIKNPIICAHSAGSLIAIDYASKNKIRELILIGPAGIKYYDSKIVLLFRIIALKTLYSIFWNPIKALSNLKVNLYNLFRNIFNKNFWILFDKNFKGNYSNKMRKIKCPTKLVWAKYDEITPLKYASDFQKNIKNSKLIVIKGSHDWPVLRPKEIMKYVEYR